jgi:hypothetical protein
MDRQLNWLSADVRAYLDRAAAFRRFHAARSFRFVAADIL